MKMQKSKLGALEAKFARVEELENNLQRNKALISEIYKQMDEKTADIENSKQQLEKLNDESKLKSPAISNLEKRIEEISKIKRMNY